MTNRRAFEITFSDASKYSSQRRGREDSQRIEGMRTKVTKEQIGFYQENGYTAIERFLTARELALWREAVDEAVEERIGRKLDGSAANRRQDYYGNVFIQTIHLSRTNEKVRKIMHDPELGNVICT